MSQAATYFALLDGGNRPASVPQTQSIDSNLNAVSQPSQILVEAHRAIVGASGATPKPDASVPQNAERDAIVQRLEQHVASGNREEAIADLSELMALQDRLYQMKQDSMATEKIVETYMNDITIFEQQQRLLMRDRQILILGLVLVLAIGGLLGFLFVSKRKSNLQLQSANQNLAKAIAQLKEAQTQLVAAEKMASLGQLTAGIAHEINNPVNFIAGNVLPLKQDVEDMRSIIAQYETEIKSRQLESHFQSVTQLKQEVEWDYISQEIDELISGIDEGANRTTEIVLGLRNFARLDEDQRKTFDLIGGIDNTLSILRNQLTDIEVVKQYEPLPDIDGYPGKMNQVFMNILTNAIQAMPEGGTLQIATKVMNNKVEIRIQDTGVGMSQAVQARVFEPFFTTKEVGDGTGLGMSISHGIIEQHQGSIELHSEEGKGTTVEIQLPLNV